MEKKGNKKKRLLRCPVCKKEVKRENKDFPFCSKRCREIDLGNWLLEDYRISTPIKENKD